ncbi:MAG: hypothetical protein ACRDUX_10410 [Mycobacterium sp.]
MPPRKRRPSAADGDARDEPAVPPGDVAERTEPDDASALAQEAEAEAEAAEAAAQAARSRAHALKLRRQATAGAAQVLPPTAMDLPDPTLTHDIPATAPELDEPVADQSADDDTDEADNWVPAGEYTGEPEHRRGFRLPRIKVKWVAAALIVLGTVTLLGASAYMLVSHRQVAQEQQRSQEFAVAARQGVVTLMSLNANNAKDDVKRIIDDTTGDFKKDFQGKADEFTTAAQESKVITEATVNATAVQEMTKDTATVLVAVTTQVSNVASRQQQPRSWRLRVDVARDGGQLKMAKVEFVP